jgi:tetratricopeptide (TPR) repeat protein
MPPREFELRFCIMMSSKLRALATALLLSTATAAGMAVLASQPAEAAGVRPAVGKALQEAIHDAGSGNGSAALAKIHEAESVGGLTSAEQQAIEQTKNYVAAKTGAGGGAVGAKAKFANDYNAGRYGAVVGADADEMRKAGTMDGQAEIIVAQAYYLMHNYQECISHIRDMGRVGQSTLELLMRCAYEVKDEQAMQGALEQLVVDFNQPKYWSDLLDSADRTSGLNNQDTLDVYRLRMLTNTMKTAADFETATEIAIQLGFPTEAQTFAQKGLETKLLAPDRGALLLNLAKANAATDAAGLAKTQAAAAAAKNGDASIKLGEDFWGMGRYQDALTAIKAGIAKGATNPDEAQIRLAMAYIGLHQRDQALQALKGVSKTAPAHTQTLARLWSIYARTH